MPVARVDLNQIGDEYSRCQNAISATGQSIPMRLVPASHDVGNKLKADLLERALIGLINESVAALPKSR